jgi:hypothetical protein
LNSGNACYHSVQNLLSSRLLSKYVYRTIILPGDLHRCETLSLTLREEHRLRVFENGGGGEEDIIQHPVLEHPQSMFLP